MPPSVLPPNRPSNAVADSFPASVSASASASAATPSSGPTCPRDYRAKRWSGEVGTTSSSDRRFEDRSDSSPPSSSPLHFLIPPYLGTYVGTQPPTHTCIRAPLLDNHRDAARVAFHLLGWSQCSHSSISPRLAILVISSLSNASLSNFIQVYCLLYCRRP
jgi:hypothetical protein